MPPHTRHPFPLLAPPDLVGCSLPSTHDHTHPPRPSSVFSRFNSAVDFHFHVHFQFSAHPRAPSGLASTFSPFSLPLPLRCPQLPRPPSSSRASYWRCWRWRWRLSWRLSWRPHPHLPLLARIGAPSASPRLRTKMSARARRTPRLQKKEKEKEGHRKRKKKQKKTTKKKTETGTHRNRSSKQ